MDRYFSSGTLLGVRKQVSNRHGTLLFFTMILLDKGGDVFFKI